MKHRHSLQIISGLGVLVTLALGLVLPAKADLTLIDHGKSAYRIVVPADAIPSERHAAEELQHYLEVMSGVRLPIVTDAETPQSREFLLGDNAHLRRLKRQIDWAKLGAEGFVLRTDGRRVIIAGGRPRGTLYGVYSLLEEQLGLRWFTPELEVVPRMQRVRLPKLDLTEVPALEYREVYWRDLMRSADLAARLKLNGDHYRLQEKHGGPAVVYFPFVHSLDDLIPRSLFDQHPEYFPLIDGKRVNGYVQRCLSNPDVLKLGIAKVREWIRDHPTATVVSVSQNDTGNWCHCDKCEALDQAEGSPSASLLKFVNAIAEDIEKDYPNVRIDTLAYQYTRKPPKTIRPRHNVIVRLCSIECCFSHPLETCPSPENRRFRDDILAWQPVAPLLYVWDYTPNFAHYQQPFPNVDVLQPNVQFFVHHGVKGLFEQGNYSRGGYGEMGPLRAYLLAKLLWNPNADLARHQAEFLDAYYGRGADKVQAYIDLLHRSVRENGYHAHIYDPPSAPYLSEPIMKQADQLLAQAEAATVNDAHRFHVQVARLPVWYVELAANRVTGSEKKELLDKFLAIARKAGISDIREGGSLDDWAKKMGAE